MASIESLKAEHRKALKKASADQWVAPQLAVLTDDAFSDPDWIYERKLDGVRLLAFAHDGEIDLMTRNQKQRNGHFPEIVDGLKASSNGHDLILDGEVVAFDGSVTSFSRLQQRAGITQPEEARDSGIPIFFYAFDLLNIDGDDIRQMPLRARKQLLRNALTFNDPIRFSAHRNRNGKEWLQDACEKGWEGLIAKRADSPYRSTRSTDWLKFKCVNRQELVITGFTDPEGERHGFGALRVGYYEDDRLIDAGKVGTGYDDALLKSLRKKLDNITRKRCPIDEGAPDDGNIHWVTPELVAEVGFTEWTRDNKLRHPRFIGLRDDKEAADVVRESPGEPEA